MSIRMLVNDLSIDKETVQQIITEDLEEKKVCACFIPHTVTVEQREERVSLSEDYLKLCEEKNVTGDESWCFVYDPETKQQSSE